MNALGVEYSAFKTFLAVGNYSRNIQLDGPKSLFAFNNIYTHEDLYILDIGYRVSACILAWLGYI